MYSFCWQFFAVAMVANFNTEHPIPQAVTFGRVVRSSFGWFVASLWVFSSFVCMYDVSLLVQSDGTEVTADALEGKKLAVYFSASWCAPCKQFTPILKSVYNQLQKDGEKGHNRTLEVRGSL